VKAHGAMVPVAGQKVLCGGDPLSGASMKCLLQCSWELFLTATTPLLRQIYKSYNLTTLTIFLFKPVQWKFKKFPECDPYMLQTQ
jgi:hypothetical protein